MLLQGVALNPSLAVVVWVFYWITFNNKINQLHEIALKIVYLDFKTYFDEPLEKMVLLAFIKYSNFSYKNIKIFG